MGRGASQPGGRSCDAVARRLLGGALSLAIPLLLSNARAANLDGSFTIFTTASDDGQIETDLTEQQAAVGLAQDFGPYLSFRFQYQYSEFESENPGGALSRETRGPGLELLYKRDRLSAFVSFVDSSTEGSVPEDRFESRTLLAGFNWEGNRGPDFEVTFSDQSNVADPGVFGRESKGRYWMLETAYGREWGQVSYAYLGADLENRSGFKTRQNRHELRAAGSRDFLDQGVSLQYGASVVRLEQRSVTTGDPGLADLVPASGGLFAVDPSPDIGELAPAPGLIDGDLASPAPAGIDIGGANTFRNVGLDLGGTAPVSRLEIFVDSVSAANLGWEVYHSADNLIWDPVALATPPEFDLALLRYTLNVEETTDRYFKVVNVSVNSEPVVFVTEIRALLELEAPATASSLESNLYRANVGAVFRPVSRLTASLDLGYNGDEDFAAGLTRRDFTAISAAARVGVALARDLRMGLEYTFSDTENRREPALLRTQRVYGGNLTWTPLPTLDTVLSVRQREESEDGRALQSNRSARLRVAMVLLPDLRLTSDFSLFELEDALSGFDRGGWSLRESIAARLTPRWSAAGTYTISDSETPEGETVLRRESYTLDTSWSPTAFLSLGGSWSFSEEDRRESFRQTYNLSYNPGLKLGLSAVHQEVETRGVGGTETDSVSLDYRLRRRASIFTSLSRSRTETAGVETGEITSLRMGLRLSI